MRFTEDQKAGGYHFDFDSHAKLVTITYKIFSTLHDRLTALQQLSQLLKIHKLLNILIDLRQTHKVLPQHEQMLLGQKIAKVMLEYPRCKTAVLKPEVNPNALIPARMITSGYKNLQQFTFKPEALQWLAAH